jgi:hypothetical protein
VIDGVNVVTHANNVQQDVDTVKDNQIVSSDVNANDQKASGWDFYDLEGDQETRWLDADIAYISELASRTRNSLKKHGFLNLRGILSQYPNPNELLEANIKGFGQGCVDDLRAFLDSKKYFTSDVKVTADKSTQEKLQIDTPTQEQVSQKTDEAIVNVVSQKETQVEVSSTTQTVQAPSQAPSQEVNQPTPIDKPTQKKESSISTDKILLMGVQPMKGLGFIYFEDWIADLENEIAETNNVPHICMINFAKGYDILTAMIRQGVLSNKLDWSTPIYVSTQAQITYAKAVSVLYQNANLVLKNV